MPANEPSPTTKLVKCLNGGLYIGLYAPIEHLEQILNGLYNHGACKEPPTLVSETFGYIVTDDNALRKGLETMFGTEQTSNTFRLGRYPISSSPRVRAQEVIDSIEQEDFFAAFHQPVKVKKFRVDEDLIVELENKLAARARRKTAKEDEIPEILETAGL